jgi:hypothetical protein
MLLMSAGLLGRRNGGAPAQTVLARRDLDMRTPLMLRRRAGPVGHPSARARFAAPRRTPVAATRAKKQKSRRLMTRSLMLKRLMMRMRSEFGLPI